MKHKRTIAWSAAAAVFCALLIGYVALSETGRAVGPQPNDRANHHPKFGDGPSN
jgi:hypothetical protein